MGMYLPRWVLRVPDLSVHQHTNGSQDRSWPQSFHLPETLEGELLPRFELRDCRTLGLEYDRRSLDGSPVTNDPTTT